MPHGGGSGGFRRARRIAALIGALILCVPLHLLWRLFRLTSPWPPIFLGLAARAVGTRVTVRGTPLAKNVFFVANHISWIDILALGGATGTAFVAKDDIGAWPVVGWLAGLNNTLFIARDRRNSVGEQVADMRAALAAAQPLTLFPEGTTGDGAALLPFKPALFAVLMPPPPGMQVQPVYLDYGQAATDIAWVGDEAAGDNIARILARRGPLDLTLHFLPPFDPAAIGDRKAISAEARKRIESRLPPSVAVPPPV